MGENLPGNKEVKIDPGKLKEIRGEFAERLEILAGTSANWEQTLGKDVGERAICGKKMPWIIGIENLLTDIGQKSNLSMEEIQELHKLLLEEKR